MENKNRDESKIKLDKDKYNATKAKIKNKIDLSKIRVRNINDKIYIYYNNDFINNNNEIIKQIPLAKSQKNKLAKEDYKHKKIEN